MFFFLFCFLFWVSPCRCLARTGSAVSAPAASGSAASAPFADRAALASSPDAAVGSGAAAPAALPLLLLLLAPLLLLLLLGLLLLVLFLLVLLPLLALLLVLILLLLLALTLLLLPFLAALHLLLAFHLARSHRLSAGTRHRWTQRRTRLARSRGSRRVLEPLRLLPSLRTLVILARAWRPIRRAGSPAAGVVVVIVAVDIPPAAVVVVHRRVAVVVVVEDRVEHPCAERPAHRAAAERDPWVDARTLLRGLRLRRLDRIVGRHVDDVRPRRLDQVSRFGAERTFWYWLAFRLPTSWAARR